MLAQIPESLSASSISTPHLHPLLDRGGEEIPVDCLFALMNDSASPFERERIEVRDCCATFGQQ